ncbi:hypothetical protein [Bradyrhizobium sp. USDA 4502]
MVWDWKKVAVRARQNLRSARHGDIETALRRAGRSVDVNTVRRAIVALEFLEWAEQLHPNIYEVLKDSPMTVVETVARWWSFSPMRATAALDEWRLGKLSARQLAQEMRSSKRAAPKLAKGESLARSFKERVEPFARLEIERRIGPGLSTKDKGIKDDLHVDFRYTHPEHGKIAVLVVGPYQNRTIYQKRRQDWMLKAVGLTYFYNLVFVVVPDPDAAKDYSRWKSNASRVDRTSLLKLKKRSPVDLDQVELLNVAVGKLAPASAT